jgi:hypothetical protein
VNVDDDRRRGAGLGELLDADGEGERVEPGAAVLARDEDSEQAGLSGRGHRLVRETVVPIDLGGKGLNDTLRQLAHRRTKGRVIGSEF